MYTAHTMTSPAAVTVALTLQVSFLLIEVHVGVGKVVSDPGRGPKDCWKNVIAPVGLEPVTTASHVIVFVELTSNDEGVQEMDKGTPVTDEAVIPVVNGGA
jgi:hypothetical protein